MRKFTGNLRERIEETKEKMALLHAIVYKIHLVVGNNFFVFIGNIKIFTFYHV